jgi:hypothetical protein
MISPKFIKRAQARLNRLSVKLSADAFRSILKNFTPEFSEITEENFEDWYEKVKSIREIRLPDADEFFKNWQEDNSTESLQDSNNVWEEVVDSSEESKEVFYSSEVLKDSLNQLNLEISSDDFKVILSSLKESFDSQEECLNEVYKVLEGYLKLQEAKRKMLIESSQGFIEENLNNSKSDIEKLQESLMNFKERNFTLTQTCGNLLSEQKKLVKIKNVLIVSVSILSLGIFGLLPLMLKQNSTSFADYLRSECTPSLSQRICKVDSRN